MAIITETIGRCEGSAGGAASLEFDYDDGTLQLVRVRVVNTQAHDVWVQVENLSNGRRAESVFGPGVNILPAPTTPPVAILHFERDAKGRLDTLCFTIRNPA